MITFDQVTKTFDASTPAVEGFSYNFKQGRTTCLVGSSGSGKTTLLRMVNRMVEPTSGTITVRGEDIAKVDPVKLRRSIGYVMQNAGLLPHRTVAQNIATVARLNKLPDYMSRVPRLMEMLTLPQSWPTGIPASFPVGRRSGLGWRGRWPPTRTFC